MLMPAALPQSRVVRLDGSSKVGNLTAASLETVSLENADGDTSDYGSGDVLNIQPAPLPELLVKGEAFLKALDFQNATNSFEAAAGEDGDFWIGPYSGLRHAEAMLDWARVDPARAGDAAKAFRTWTENHADSYWLPRAQMGSAFAMAMSGDVDGATSLMQKLADTAFEKNLGRHVELQVNLVRCEAFLIGGQAEVAEARLRDLVVKLDDAVRDPKSPEGTRSLFGQMSSRAQILLGEAITEKDGLRTAASYWQGLADDRNATADVRAAAWIGIARSARENGQPRQAQLQLAKVVATLPASEDVMAHALYELGEVSKELGNNPTSGDAYHQRLLEQYPNTTWASKVR
jgi:tetratricopeptide (TPR) repeat protein